MVVSSDLQRARRTASVAAESLGLTFEVDPALSERDVGAWQGLTIIEIKRQWPDELKACRSGRLAAPPDGDPDHVMASLLTYALRRLFARPEDALLVVTHGGLLRLVERGVGLEPSSTPNLSGRWVHGTGADGWASLVAGAPFLPELGAVGQAVATVPGTAERR